MIRALTENSVSLDSILSNFSNLELRDFSESKGIASKGNKTVLISNLVKYYYSGNSEPEAQHQLPDQNEPRLINTESPLTKEPPTPNLSPVSAISLVVESNQIVSKHGDENSVNDQLIDTFDDMNVIRNYPGL